jgi:type I restriction enzyme, S subunit
MKQKNKFKETEIGFIPEDWEVLELKDIASYITEKIDLDEININNFVSTENMLADKGGIAIASSLPKVGKVTKFKEGDILFSNIRTYFKKLWLAKFSGGCSNDVLVIREKTIANNRYLYYFLSQDKFFEFTVLTSKGTKMPRGDKNSIMSYEINLPPFPEQLTIAKILSYLDLKIELNKKMNKNLESIGQAIFKRWFVDFEFPDDNGKPYKSSGGEMIFNEELDKNIPKGWRVSTIGDQFQTILGGTPSTQNKDYWKNGTVAWINSGEINKFRITEPTAYITEDAVNKSATKLMPKGTTILAITGATLGQVSRIEIDTCANQSVIGIIENKEIPSEYIYLWIKYNIIDLISHQTGGAQQHINKNNVNELKILLPDDSLMLKFRGAMNPIFKNISINCFESQNLSKIRDSLLPKLMSGKIRVPVEVRT